MHCPWLHFYLLFMFVVSSRLRSIVLAGSNSFHNKGNGVPLPSPENVEDVEGDYSCPCFSNKCQKLKDPLYLSPLLFSVNYHDAFILSSHLVL